MKITRTITQTITTPDNIQWETTPPKEPTNALVITQNLDYMIARYDIRYHESGKEYHWVNTDGLPPIAWTTLPTVKSQSNRETTENTYKQALQDLIDAHVQDRADMERAFEQNTAYTPDALSTAFEKAQKLLEEIP